MSNTNKQRNRIRDRGRNFEVLLKFGARVMLSCEVISYSVEGRPLDANFGWLIRSVLGRNE